MTLMELIVGGFLGLLLVLCGGYLFTTQVKGYLDIRDQTRTLADVPGGMTLAFNYMDRAGAATMDVSKIKAVRMDLTLNTKKVAGRPGRTRKQSLQVELPNLL
jgi:hypothetical protein